MGRAWVHRDPGERSGQDLWERFEEQAGKIGWNLVKEDKGEGLEMVGWLQDGFGNEIHVIKRLDVTDLRLVIYLFFESEAFTREVLLRIADLCWLDGLTWRVEKDPNRPDSTLLLGFLLSPARITQDHLWYVFNVMVFSEFAIRKLMPPRKDKELKAMLQRFTRNWTRLNAPAGESQPKPEPGPGDFEGCVRVEEQSERFQVYSLSDPRGDHCIALCSRVPEHREFCWLIPEDTDIWNDFVRTSAYLSGRRTAEPSFVSIDGGPVENQVVRILGDWSRDWKFTELIYEDNIFLGVENRKSTFRVYRMYSQTNSSWVLHNASLCDSLWVLDEATFQEFKELLSRWIRRIEVV